jgi:hypothetical protein
MNKLCYVRFEILTAVAMKNAVFGDVALCRFCVNRRFGGTYRLHLQGRKIRERGNSVSRWLQSARSRILLPWRWRLYDPPKRRFTQNLHSATSQKAAFFKLCSILKNLSDLSRKVPKRYCFIPICQRWMSVQKWGNVDNTRTVFSVFFSTVTLARRHSL